MSWSEEHVLRRRLVDAGMAVLVEEDRIPSGEAGAPLLAGLFCLAHMPEVDRLIVGRRPGRQRWLTFARGKGVCVHFWLLWRASRGVTRQ